MLGRLWMGFWKQLSVGLRKMSIREQKTNMMSLRELKHVLFVCGGGEGCSRSPEKDI